MTSKIRAKLKDPEYRKAFVASLINIGIPFQIRALIKAKGWTQEELARRTGMLQPRISAIQTPGKVRPNIETLRRIAEAFDCGLEIRFVPFSELVWRSEQFNPETFDVPSYEEEAGKGVFRSFVDERHDHTNKTMILNRNVIPFPTERLVGQHTFDPGLVQVSNSEEKIYAYRQR